MYRHSILRSLSLFLLCLTFHQYSLADDIHVAVERGSIKAVKAALEANQHAVNAPREDGKFPLHIAAEVGSLKIIDILIDAGADIHAENRYTSTALRIAINHGQAEVVKRLISAGALDRPEEAQRALHLAAQTDAEMTGIIIAAGADVNVRDPLNCTALHVAVHYKKPDVVEVLVNAGADVNAFDGHDFTPLLELCKYNPVDDPSDNRVPAILEIARILLRAGADPHVTDEDKWTILHFAAWFDVPDLVKLLVDEGLDVGAVDKHGNTPLDLARRQGFQRVIRILETAEK